VGANRAIDGNVNGNFSSGSVSCTNNDLQSLVAG
jgi:hypothetical protein